MLSLKETSVLHVLLKLSSYFGKRYGFPSQKTIVRLCDEWFGVEMSRRTLNRVLASLEAKGFFERVRRISKKPDGSLWLRSTLYKLKSAAFSWIWGLKTFLKSTKSLFAVTKMAHNPSQGGRSSTPCGQLGILIARIVPEGGPAGIFIDPSPT
jgi:DNA-binding HxlR family transcriptional regulator